MKLILIALFTLLLLATPALLGWILRGLLVWRFPKNEWYVDRSHLLRIAQLLCVLGGVVTVLFWLSHLFSHAASMLVGAFFYGPGLFMLTFFKSQASTLSSS
jgi:hypothetical protein